MDKNVTIVLDSQAGSCGKGKICGYIAQKLANKQKISNCLLFIILSFYKVIWDFSHKPNFSTREEKFNA